MPYLVFPVAFREVTEKEYQRWIRQWIQNPLPKNCLMPVAEAVELLGISEIEVLEKGRRKPGNGALWLVEFRSAFVEFALDVSGGELEGEGKGHLQAADVYVYPTPVFKRYGRKLINLGEGLRPGAESATAALRREREERRNMEMIKGWADMPLPKGYPFAEGEE